MRIEPAALELVLLDGPLGESCGLLCGLALILRKRHPLANDPPARLVVFHGRGCCATSATRPALRLALGRQRADASDLVERMLRKAPSESRPHVRFGRSLHVEHLDAAKLTNRSTLGAGLTPPRQTSATANLSQPQSGAPTQGLMSEHGDVTR